MDPAAVPPAAQAFGPFVLDPAAAQLRRDGLPVDLAPRPWAVLVHLVARAGQLVSKDELLDAVWGHRHVTDAALKVAINSLRTRLGDDAAAPTYIATVSRRGYRFIAPVSPAGWPGGVAPEAGAREPGPSAPAPAPFATQKAVGNLPASPIRLVGRDPELIRLQGLLPTQRLVTLLGPGGVGKTQLALTAAQASPPADGVWLVRLDGMHDAAPLLDTVARTLSLGANASRDVATLAHALSPLTLRIVLDNAEHLIDALAPLVTRLLQDAPGVHLLVTSQSALRVAGEVLLPVPALGVPAEGTRGDLLRYPAVALFVERVRAQDPGYSPDDVSLDAIAAICRLLDGLPLAIELAAARVPLLGVAGVLARMSDRFALLSRGARDAPQRHRTLREAVAWSFGLLDGSTRRVQRHLSVMAGSFTLATAQSVVGEDEWVVLEALQTLLDQSLLTQDAPEPGSDPSPRFRQLESVRALAADELRQAGEESAARQRLVQAMEDLFGHAHAHYTRTPLLHWLRPLRPEADNLRLAMSHATTWLAADDATAAGGDALGPAVRLFSHAMLFWLRSGRKREAIAWFERVSPASGRLQLAGLRAPYGLAVGALAAYAQSMPPAAALPWLQEAEQTFVAMGDPRSAMLALYLQAALMQRIAPQDDRGPLLARMRALEAPDWSLRERNFAAWTDAVNAHGHGDLQAFRAFCALDLARARASDDRAEAWVAAFGLGQALWTLGERAQATQTLAEAVDDLRSAGLLREYATTAALAASMRLAQAFDLERPPLDELAWAELIGGMREAADVIRAEGMLWWMGDALMMLPIQRGDWQAALQLQGWIDRRMQTLGMKRSPVAQTLRDQFEQRLGHARHDRAWSEPALEHGGDLDDPTVLRMSFG